MRWSAPCRGSQTPRRRSASCTTSGPRCVQAVKLVRLACCLTCSSVESSCSPLRRHHLTANQGSARSQRSQRRSGQSSQRRRRRPARRRSIASFRTPAMTTRRQPRSRGPKQRRSHGRRSQTTTGRRRRWRRTTTTTKTETRRRRLTMMEARVRNSQRRRPRAQPRPSRPNRHPQARRAQRRGHDTRRWTRTPLKRRRVTKSTRSLHLLLQRRRRPYAQVARAPALGMPR